MNTDTLALQLASRTCGELVAGHIYHHAQSQLGYGIRVLAGSVHNYDALGLCGGQIDIVVTGACTYYDTQFRCCGQHLGRNLVAADDEALDICHGFEKLCLVGIFLKQDSLVSRIGEYRLDALHGLVCEGLFGCYEYFHRFACFNGYVGLTGIRV